MLTKRIIPCLDVTAGRVVKGVNFVELKDAGDPVEGTAAHAQIYFLLRRREVLQLLEHRHPVLALHSMEGSFGVPVLGGSMFHRKTS